MHFQTLMDVFFRAFGTLGRPLVTNDFRVELPLGAIAIRCGSYLPVIAAALFLFLRCTIHPYSGTGILILEREGSSSVFNEELRLTNVCGQSTF